MKGHVKLELRNANGETKVVHQDNLITNAVPMFIGNIITTRSLSGTDVDIANTLGGILLFEESLDENKNNIVFPYKNACLAYGSNTNNTSIPGLGTFKTSESGNTPDGIKMVWDFDSSQANGVIKALALTHVKHMTDDPICHWYYPVGDVLNISTTWIFNHKNFKCLGVDDQNAFYILAKTSSSGTIYKCTNSCNGSIKSKISVAMEVIKDLGTNYSSIVSATNGFDGYAYIAYYYSNLKKIEIKRYNFSDQSFEEDANFSFETNTTELAFSVNSSSVLTDNYLACVNGSFYICKRGETQIYKLDKDVSDVKFIVLEKALGMWDQISADEIYIYPAITKSNPQIYNLRTGKIKKHAFITQSSSYGYPSGGCFIAKNGIKLNAYDSKLNFVESLPYLGTICNLKTPIEKTADQTLRVTYTLTDINT